MERYSLVQILLPAFHFAVSETFVGLLLVMTANKDLSCRNNIAVQTDPTPQQQSLESYK